MIDKPQNISKIININKNIFKENFSYSESLEGYSNGVFGCKSGPTKGDFDALCHELSHGVHMYRKDKSRLSLYEYGLRITTSIEILGENYYEPISYQATTLECEVIAIQFHIMEACQIPHDSSDYWAKILQWLPDSLHGGNSEKERFEKRKSLIGSFYKKESIENIIDDLNEMVVWVRNNVLEENLLNSPS